jgi:uncharacterized membrane protein SirB2
VIEFYPQIKLVHVATVLASGGLFLIRGLAVQLGAGWGMAAPLRYLSYTIDTVLLAAALLLTAILQLSPFAHTWLAVKVALLIVYIVLGVIALRRGRTVAARRVCWIAALLVYAMMISVARTHHPLAS